MYHNSVIQKQSPVLLYTLSYIFLCIHMLISIDIRISEISQPVDFHIKIYHEHFSMSHSIKKYIYFKAVQCSVFIVCQDSFLTCFLWLGIPPSFYYSKPAAKVTLTGFSLSFLSVPRASLLGIKLLVQNTQTSPVHYKYNDSQSHSKLSRSYICNIILNFLVAALKRNK